MAAFEKHVFVCTNTREPGHPRGCCGGKDSNAIRDHMKDLIAKAGLKKKIRINTTGCLDQCEHGVTIVVYPETVWYGFVQMEDVEAIVNAHLIGGHPVERLRLQSGCINTPQCEHKKQGAK